jgi:hypothetical protein
VQVKAGPNGLSQERNAFFKPPIVSSEVSLALYPNLPLVLFCNLESIGNSLTFLDEWQTCAAINDVQEGKFCGRLKSQKVVQDIPSVKYVCERVLSMAREVALGAEVDLDTCIKIYFDKHNAGIPRTMNSYFKARAGTHTLTPANSYFEGVYTRAHAHTHTKREKENSMLLF